MVNETESIPNEPVGQRFMWKNILEYNLPSEEDMASFRQALVQKDTLRAEQADETARLKIVNPQKLDNMEFANQCKLMLRIARSRGIPV